MKRWILNLWMNKNYRLATLLGLLLCGWLLSGVLADTSEPGPVPDTATAAALAVKARVSLAQPYGPQMQVRASTEANRRVEVRAEVAGRVRALPAAEGSAVAAAAVLCEIEPEDRALRVVQAQAVVEQARIEYDGSLRLQSGGYQSAVAIAGAKARLHTAEAELLRRQLDLSNTRILAPFAGYVEQHAVEVGDFVERGDLCAVVLDLDPLRAVGRLSEAEVLQVREMAPATLQLQGATIPGAVQFVGREADAATRTYRVEASFANPGGRYVAGMTADLSIPLSTLTAHLIPSTLLTLDDHGNTGIRALDARSRVVFHPVTLLGDNPDGVWVGGLPERINLITVGQEYTSIGAQVEATPETGPAPAVVAP
jgi:multidrug efflux system membrane fusion protein